MKSHDDQTQQYVIAYKEQGLSAYDIIRKLVDSKWKEQDAVVAVLKYYAKEKKDIYTPEENQLSSGALFYYVPPEQLSKKISWKLPLSVAVSLIVALVPFFFAEGILEIIAKYTLLFMVPIFLTYVIIIFRRLVTDPLLSMRQYSGYYYLGNESLIMKKGNWEKAYMYRWGNYHTVLSMEEMNAKEMNAIMSTIETLRKGLSNLRDTVSQPFTLFGGKKSFLSGSFDRVSEVSALPENQDKVYQFLREKIKK